MLKTINNLDVFFSSKNNLTDIDYKKYKSTILKTHSLPDDNLKRITLFHGIYYNLFDFFNQITYYSDIIDTLLNEYKTIISSINKSIKILDSKNCSEIISSQEREDVDITHTQTSIHLGSWRKEPRLSKESFTLSSVPIYVNNTIYDEVHFTYNDEECNRYILFYMFSFTIRGNELLHNRIYFVYLLKLMRNYFLFSSSILFLVVLFYISMEIIAKYLIEPIKHVKKLMLKLIRDHGFSEEDLDSDQKINAFGFFAGVIGKNISPEENKLKLNQNLREFGNLRNNEDNDKEDELGLYANVETYELEELLNFLKKIIMMKTSGNVDYKERSRIYNRFLSFLDDLEERDYYRQCLNIIAYSKYKEQKYDEALVNLKDLLESAKNDEKELLLKCDKFENKIIKLPLIFKMPYVNDFTDNKFYLFPINTQKILKIRILKQKILYFAGLLCFLEYKNHKVQSKKELLVEGLIYLKESLQINQTLGTNHLKNIFTLILISKLYYKLEDYNNALINIKDALVKFIELNNYFFDKKLEEVFDSRIIFIIVNIVFEQIFSLNASICNKIGKKQLSALIYNNLLSKCFFISRDVHIDIFHKLNIFLFEPTNRDIGIHEETESSHDASKSEKKGTYKLIAKKKDSEFYKKLRKSIILDNENKDSFYKNIDQIKNFNSMSKETKLGVESKFEKARYMFYKSCNRKSSISKFLFILVSETLLNQFISNFEMKEVILKSIKKYLNLSDLIAYASFDQEILNYISGSSRDFNYKQFEKNKNFFACSEGYNNAKEKKSIFETLQFAYEKMIGTGGNDQYIFIFCLSNEFKFDSEEEARQLIKMGLHYKTTIYLFVFDYEVKKKRVDKLLVYLSNFVEAYLVIVKNFKIIEEAFQNISILGDQSNKRNILSYTYENHNYILGGLGKTYYINEN